MKILPSELDKQDVDKILWIFLTNDEEKNNIDEDGAYMGLF